MAEATAIAKDYLIVNGPVARHFRSGTRVSAGKIAERGFSIESLERAGCIRADVPNVANQVPAVPIPDVPPPESAAPPVASPAKEGRSKKEG